MAEMLPANLVDMPAKIKVKIFQNLMRKSTPLRSFKECSENSANSAPKPFPQFALKRRACKQFDRDWDLSSQVLSVSKDFYSIGKEILYYENKISIIADYEYDNEDVSFDPMLHVLYGSFNLAKNNEWTSAPDKEVFKWSGSDMSSLSRFRQFEVSITRFSFMSQGAIRHMKSFLAGKDVTCTLSWAIASRVSGISPSINNQLRDLSCRSLRVIDLTGADISIPEKTLQNINTTEPETTGDQMENILREHGLSSRDLLSCTILEDRDAVLGTMNSRACDILSMFNPARFRHETLILNFPNMARRVACVSIRLRFIGMAKNIAKKEVQHVEAAIESLENGGTIPGGKLTIKDYDYLVEQDGYNRWSVKKILACKSKVKLCRDFQRRENLVRWLRKESQAYYTRVYRTSGLIKEQFNRAVFEFNQAAK